MIYWRFRLVRSLELHHGIGWATILFLLRILKKMRRKPKFTVKNSPIKHCVIAPTQSRAESENDQCWPVYILLLPGTTRRPSSAVSAVRVGASTGDCSLGGPVHPLSLGNHRRKKSHNHLYKLKHRSKKYV